MPAVSNSCWNMLNQARLRLRRMECPWELRRKEKMVERTLNRPVRPNAKILEKAIERRGSLLKCLRTMPRSGFHLMPELKKHLKGVKRPGEGKLWVKMNLYRSFPKFSYFDPSVRFHMVTIILKFFFTHFGCTCLFAPLSKFYVQMSKVGLKIYERGRQFVNFKSK